MIRRFLIALLVLAPWLAQAQLESTADLQRGLVGWWRFNEGTGTNAFDLSGNNNTGTLSGSTLPVWTNGVFGGAISLDGTNGYVSLPTTSSLNLPLAISISAWVKPSLAATVFIAVADVTPGGAQGQYTLYIGADGKQNLAWGNGVTAATWKSSNAVENTGVWQHIAVTRDSSRTVILYYNGSTIAGSFTSGSSSTTAYASQQGTVIGRNGADSVLYAKGLVDDVRIYSRVLSATEVLNLYCQGGGRTP